MLEPTASAHAAMIKLRRDRIWRWRCQWSVVTLAAVGLVLYNGAANVLLLRSPRCRERAPAPASLTPVPATTCEPCADTPPPSAQLDDEPLSRFDLRLGRWDTSRNYRLYDYAAVGDSYADLSAERRVSLATQSSVERLHELLRIAAHWSGPMSVAVFVTGDELRLLCGFATWLLHCQPEVYARLALHVATPAERQGVHGRLPHWAKDCSSQPLPAGERSPETIQWRSRHPYPQNHMRNLARKNCHTPFVFLVDIDIVPSKGMAEALDVFLGRTPKCPLCAYVVPTYELDRRVATFPANKSEVLRLSRHKLAIPFHRKVFIYNQFASNFSRWEASGGNESAETHVSHNVTNFELLYEPFYVAADTVPAHDERFLGYGFTRNTQHSTKRYPSARGQHAP
ncbi:beta-1,4-glucuronyltransferase 1-like isoform X2 [Pectinophora gossypiella]|uniref:beta-1,4-glucuronyltransferase 1-like isoform X2 n=1 Tax=Pectinophora gossypiella TaxID=13191 RepID=UPI00214E07B5|nr:beta-1,4-glucuronyltransferase 1-like isoform X2 [Pectinophora gossypiella]